MIVMPANSTGWFWHCLARETRRIGHLYSPGAQRGPWPWFPFALDNGAFSAWNPEDNSFMGWDESAWLRLIFWACSQRQKPIWAIIPDRPGKWDETVELWEQYAGTITIPHAIAVQDGATPEAVRALAIQPEVIAVGGSTEWKWETAEMWIRAFPRVHVLRCNSPEKLHWLESLGCESCDGTGWNRGNKTQTKGVERWARSRVEFGRVDHELWPHTCRETKQPDQLTFA